ncbi:MAG: DUF3883 domain-containing protein [Pirellulaceae bacterium]
MNTEDQAEFAMETKTSELLAMAAVMDAERALGNDPVDVSAEKRGYDIESRDGKSNRLRFIEVKGRVEGAKTVMITRGEIVKGINASESFILAIVPISDQKPGTPVYVRHPFEREPDFNTATVAYYIEPLIAKGRSPS